MTTENGTVGNVARMDNMRNSYKIFVGKPEWKRTLRRPMSIWKYDTRVEVMEIEWEGVDWIHLAQDGDQWRGLVNTVMNFRVA
jgi:hypothetical protein